MCCTHSCLHTGTNERNKREGDFPLDSLYIIPTLSKPSPDILVGHKNIYPLHPSNTGSNPQTPFTKAETVTRSYDTVSKRSGAGDNVHTLETFATAHFR